MKPYYDYWEGKAVQKSGPTLLHMLTQGLLKDMLKEAGYQAGTELELRIAPYWHPIPDVVAATKFQMQPYPTEALDVVVEVLSPDDRSNFVEVKCQKHSEIGIKRVIVVNPEQRLGLFWNVNASQLFSANEVDLPNGKKFEFRRSLEQVKLRT